MHRMKRSSSSAQMKVFHSMWELLVLKVGIHAQKIGSKASMQGKLHAKLCSMLLRCAVSQESLQAVRALCSQEQ